MNAERAMRLALAEARRASGRTWPNPPVGAVVFRGERVLGRGHTRPVGGPHAEVVALESARRRHGAAALRGASLAVTLEPCAHQGRTGPCTELILAAGIPRVLVGHRDPNPRVSGRGFRRLRAQGVEVVSNVLEAECREQHRGFATWVRSGRPHVALKLAASLDGRIASAGGESRWITGEAARARVHRLRDAADAVMVGSATALADDPELSVRRAGRRLRTPVRVLLDSRLTVPLRVRLFADGAADRTWVLVGRRAAARARRAREAAGARVLEVASRGGHLDLGSALSRLGREGLTFLLVEGGGGLAAALLREGLVDEVHWFLAPRILGGDGRPAVAALGAVRLADAVRVRWRRTRRLGRDLYLHGVVERDASREERR